MTLKFKTIRFLTSIFDIKDIPKTDLPEIIITGRSNVGKSSLINHLFNKKIAKTSSLAGKTKSINHFLIDEQTVLADFPGYGYAKRSYEEQVSWSKIIDHYLHTNMNIKCILLLLDARRIISKDDLSFINWLNFYKKPAILIFTKTDKLKKADLDHNIKKNFEILQNNNLSIFLDHIKYSINSKTCMIPLISKINEII